uniref:Uncharacterized protein n=1 Tax=Arundo donax TaxID=35708 RepID=A0A0A9GLN9_ARUDO
MVSFVTFFITCNHNEVFIAEVVYGNTGILFVSTGINCNDQMVYFNLL